jgi:peroxiredoxin
LNLQANLGDNDMAKVELHTPAPDFALQDFRGQTVQLGGYRGKKHVALVFNRGFM